MQCPNCKRTIQPSRRTCPYCGHSLPARRREVLLLGLTAAIIFVLFFAGGLALAFLHRSPPASPPIAAAASATPSPTHTAAAATTTAAAAQATATTVATLPPSPTAVPATGTPTTPPPASPAPTRAVVIPPTLTPAVPPPPTPDCTTPVDPDITPLWQAEYAQLGCATGAASDIWSAWQEYEHGAMLWRSDTKQITILYEDGHQQTVADTWDGNTVYNDKAPAGLVTPERGFAWAWHNQAGVQSSLGWATSDELGFCAHLQPFEHGFAFVSTGTPCSNELNRAREPGFRPLAIVVLQNGSWNRY